MAYPPTRVLTGDEMDLVWRFRFFLTRDPKGLTKFLKSVTWSDAAEAAQATEVILPKWQNPAIDDALELLGPGFQDKRVRAYAVGLLEKADDSVSATTKPNLHKIELIHNFEICRSSSSFSFNWCKRSNSTALRSSRARFAKNEIRSKALLKTRSLQPSGVRANRRDRRGQCAPRAQSTSSANTSWRIS